MTLWLNKPKVMSKFIRNYRRPVTKVDERAFVFRQALPRRVGQVQELP